jgi:hypothetical protein
MRVNIGRHIPAAHDRTGPSGDDTAPAFPDCSPADAALPCQRRTPPTMENSELSLRNLTVETRQPVMPPVGKDLCPLAAAHLSPPHLPGRPRRTFMPIAQEQQSRQAKHARR